MAHQSITTPTAPLAHTPLYDWHVAHGANFTAIDGWQIPLAYLSPERESAAARSGLGLADISGLAKVSLRGPGVPDLAVALVKEGRVLQPRGVSIVSADAPVLACRLAVDSLMLLATTTRDLVLERLPAGLLAGRSVVQSDATCAYAAFCLSGADHEQVLRQLTPLDVSPTALPPGSCAETNLAGVHALLVRSAAMALPSTWIYVAWDVGEYVWERVEETGHFRGLTPLGLESWRSLLLPVPAADSRA